MGMPPLLEIADLHKSYRSGGLFSRSVFAAVDGVSMLLEDRPQILAVVGESGSGKTTLARMVLRLIEPSAGRLTLLGRPLPRDEPGAADDLEFRRLVQPIFQNPFESFSAHLPIELYLLRTALNLKVARDRMEAETAARAALHAVGLDFARIRGKFPRQFSGGELQRIAIARALIPRPRLVVADEPVSMVDASLRMNLVNLFRSIRDEQDVSFIYITHDLSTAHYVSDQVAIMKSGRIVESGDPRDVLANPAHLYTRELIDAVPRVGERWPELQDLRERDTARPTNPVAIGS